VMSWMATHYSPNTNVQFDKELAHGMNGIYAAKESGRHPDTGYAASCWTANLNGPVYEKIRRQVLGVCERTGLAGFLWDSFSNLGWWQVDYSDGSMRPQYDKMAQLYADLNNAGLYIMPESITTFSNHSCCGLHGGNIYKDDLLGYAYNTNISYWAGEGDDHGGGTYECQVLTGKVGFDIFFQAIAHRRLAGMHFHMIPREQWDPANTAAMKELFAIYKQHRGLMQKRTVLKGDAGVLWENGSETRLFFSFKEQQSPVSGKLTDAGTGAIVEGEVQANRVYLII